MKKSILILIQIGFTWNGGESGSLLFRGSVNGSKIKGSESDFAEYLYTIDGQIRDEGQKICGAASIEGSYGICLEKFVGVFVGERITF